MKPALVESNVRHEYGECLVRNLVVGGSGRGNDDEIHAICFWQPHFVLEHLLVTTIHSQYGFITPYTRGFDASRIGLPPLWTWTDRKRSSRTPISPSVTV